MGSTEMQAPRFSFQAIRAILDSRHMEITFDKHKNNKIFLNQWKYFEPVSNLSDGLIVIAFIQCSM
jgi:hypothetical protein